MTAKERADAKELEILNRIRRAETRAMDREAYRRGLRGNFLTGQVMTRGPEDEEQADQWSTWSGVNLAAAGRRITAKH